MCPCKSHPVPWQLQRMIQLIALTRVKKGMCSVWRSEMFSMVPSPEPVPELTGPERRYPVRLRTPVDRLTN